MPERAAFRRDRVRRGGFEYRPGVGEGGLQLVAEGLGEAGGAECAGGESLCGFSVPDDPGRTCVIGIPEPGGEDVLF